MLLFHVTVNATFILLVSAALLAIGRSLPAVAKHSLCVVALGVIVLLPVLAMRPVEAQPALWSIAFLPLAPSGARESWVEWAVWAWACGAGAVGCRLLAGYGYLAWQTKRATYPGLEFKKQGLDVRFAEVSTPVIWGLAQPTILLPQRFREWSPDLQKAALDHEAAHLQRRDGWTALLVVAAQAMYWFHPLVWWLSNRLAQEREFAVDDRVLALGTDRNVYAELLVEVARNSSTGLLFGCGMVSGSLRTRVDHLLGFNAKPVLSGFQLRLMTSCCIAFLMLTAFVLPVDGRLPEELYKIGGDVTPPQVIQKVEPKYTRQSRRAKRQGVVLLGLVIGVDGKARDIKVEKSLTDDLDRQAVRAVSSWRFRPATKAGQPVTVQAKVEVNFRLL